MTAAPYPKLDGTQPCTTDPEIFFPDSKVESDVTHANGPDSPAWNQLAPGTRQGYFDIQFATDLCAACPFRRPCLAYGLTHDVIGIWGGTTTIQRRHLRDQHGITAQPITVSDAELRAIDIDRFERGGGGASAADISRALGISKHAVKQHRARRRNATEGAHP